MHCLEARRNSRTCLWAGAAVLALWAFFSPALGPMMDHHFAERQHSHAHIYFGPPDVEHVHPYQDHHIHRLIQWANDNGMSDGLPGPTLPIDTVYLTPQDGMGQDSLASLTPATQSMDAFPDQGDPSLFFAWTKGDDSLQEAHVPPLKKPPRA